MQNPIKDKNRTLDLPKVQSPAGSAGHGGLDALRQITEAKRDERTAYQERFARAEAEKQAKVLAGLAAFKSRMQAHLDSKPVLEDAPKPPSSKTDKNVAWSRRGPEPKKEKQDKPKSKPPDKRPPPPAPPSAPPRRGKPPQAFFINKSAGKAWLDRLRNDFQRAEQNLKQRSKDSWEYLAGIQKRKEARKAREHKVPVCPSEIEKIRRLCGFTKEQCTLLFLVYLECAVRAIAPKNLTKQQVQNYIYGTQWQTTYGLKREKEKHDKMLAKIVEAMRQLEWVVIDKLDKLVYQGWVFFKSVNRFCKKLTDKEWTAVLQTGRAPPLWHKYMV